MESNLMNAYLAAYKLAAGKLKDCDFEEVSLNSNAFYNKEGHSLTVQYLGQDYTVDCLTGDVKLAGMQVPVTTTVKVLILHYLLHARIKPLTGKLISFKEMPGGGAIYYQTFQKRAINPLVKTFGNRPEALYRASEAYNGVIEKYGHASVTIKVFPLIPVTYVVWQGDEEFPASGTILFDETVTSFLPGEDIVLAASFGVYGLMEQARNLG